MEFLLFSYKRLCTVHFGIWCLICLISPSSYCFVRLYRCAINCTEFLQILAISRSYLEIDSTKTFTGKLWTSNTMFAILKLIIIQVLTMCTSKYLIYWVKFLFSLIQFCHCTLKSRQTYYSHFRDMSFLIYLLMVIETILTVSLSRKCSRATWASPSVSWFFSWYSLCCFVVPMYTATNNKRKNVEASISIARR